MLAQPIVVAATMVSRTNLEVVENLSTSSTTHRHSKPSTTLLVPKKHSEDPRPFNQSIPITTSTNETQREDQTRQMALGRCNFLVPVGKLRIPCTCQQGIFDADAGRFTLSNSCEICGHALLDHESACIAASHQKIIKTDIPPAVDPLNCPRHETVSALWTLLQEVRVVHVRGTPTSGKSTMALFLEQHVKRLLHDRLPIHRFRWTPGTLSSASSYNHLLNNFTNQTARYDWLEMSALIIIDEAQLSYEYNDLWHGLIKILASDPKGGPYVILFSSYGSATKSPVPSEYTATPVLFTSSQRVSIRPLSPNNADIGLYLTRREFDDVVERVCDYYGKHGERFLPSAEGLNYIWEFSNGHPGGVRVLLDMLIHSPKLRQFQQSCITINVNNILEALDGDTFFFTQLSDGSQGFKRSLPTREALQDRGDVARLLQDLLVFDYLDGNPELNDALDCCYRMGWVQAEISLQGKQVYVLPTRIHKRYLEILLRKELPSFPNHMFPSVEELCFQAIRKFSRSRLRSGGHCLGVGAEIQPFESQYQNEFYRACYILLNRNVYLISEWAASSTAGRADFHIHSIGWTIECVRDGDRLGEHIARFEQGGKYHGAIRSGQTKEYILLDFRTSKPRKVRENIRYLYHIVFSDDLAEYSIYNTKLHQILGPVALLEQ